jgi:hypothetical protein
MWFNRKASIGLILGIGLSVSFAASQFKSLAELYKTGKIRFVPEITITDEAMGGKDFFNNAVDLALDDRGNVFVCDSRANNIKVFDPMGKYLRTIGKAGQGPGDFNYPVEIEFARERFFVRELMNGRVSILNREGIFLKSVSLQESGTIWWNMAALPDGRLVVEKEKTNIDKPGLPQECSIEIYSGEFSFVKSLYQQKIWRNKYIKEPRTTNIPIPFAPLVHWHTAGEGMIAIGYSEKYEIGIYDPDKGLLKMISHDYRPSEVTSKDKDQYFKSMGFAYSNSSGMTTQQRGAPDFIIKLTEFPKFKPPYNGIRIDPEGNIWVRVNDPEKSSGASFDAFTPGGGFISGVKLAQESVFPHRLVRKGPGFWTIKMDKDGEYAIVKMRIEAAK